MKFVLNRTLTHTTTTGHAIAFIKGEPTHVPPEAHGSVLAIGAVPETDLVKEEVVSREPTVPAVRKAMLMAAIGEIVARNGREDFSGTGQPHLRVIANIAGFGIDARELDVLWDEFMQGKADADRAKVDAEQARIDAAVAQKKADAEAAQAEAEAAQAEADAAAKAEADAAVTKTAAAKPAAKPAGRQAKAKG